VDDLGVDINLSEFFTTIGTEKKRKKEELDSLISNSFEDFFLQPLKEEIAPKKVKRKKKIEPQITESITESNVEIVANPPTLIEKSLGLLSEPDDTNQQNDPITPLDQNFVTLDQLNQHYNKFLSRIQQQLSTLGGGGETNLTFMDVPITSVTSPSYEIKLRDYYVGVNYAGAVTITLPRANREGKIFIIKDELGESSKGTNRYITILPAGTDLIDGKDRVILAYDYGSLTFIWKGNSWRII
jgi:hypothetical protein